jgi:hypothetical protein
VYPPAVAGYEQPQSLLALSYLLSLGTHFDLVILLDGFNEVALPIRDNVFTGVFPFFPRSWGQRVANLDLATGTRALIGELAYLNERRGAWASWLADSPLRSSSTATLLWILYDRRLESRIVEARVSLSERRAGEPFDYLATGPRWPSSDIPALYEDLAQMWKRSALAMHALCKENDIPFFVFLQPNQYLPESKPMGPEERGVAILDQQPFAESVRVGCPLLRRAGHELRLRGIHFTDLTQVFADVREPIYIDNCCHVGKRGNEILADAMSDAIIASMREDATRRAPDRSALSSPD